MREGVLAAYELGIKLDCLLRLGLKKIDDLICGC